MTGSGGVVTTEESPLIGRNHDDHELHRHLSLFDLVCVGVGATVGSGVFVLIGLIASTSAGPAVFISWSIAGLAACASGLCYAELGARFPSAGSSYVYAKETMGELASVIAAACLTLEYTGSASAVARSWGDKVVTYIRSRNSDSIFIPILDPGLGINPCAFVVSLASVIAAACLTLEYTGSASAVARSWGDKVVTYIRSRNSDSIFIPILDPGLGINPCAFVVSLGSVILLLKGVKESKSVTNFFSTLNVSLVLFMAVMSIILAKKENLTPLVPPEFGTSGILRGATSSFFGYIGFDEICCVSGEAKDPSKNVPRAIILTLLIVTALYISASLGLVGMVPYEQISQTSGFPEGFRYAGSEWAAEMTAVSHVQI